MGRAGVRAQALSGGGFARRIAAASCPASAPELCFVPGSGLHHHARYAKPFPAGYFPPDPQTSPGVPHGLLQRDAYPQGQERVRDVLRLQPPHIPDPPHPAANALVFTTIFTPTLSDRHE